jgi:hypothetical protein
VVDSKLQKASQNSAIPVYEISPLKQYAAVVGNTMTRALIMEYNNKKASSFH